MATASTPASTDTLKTYISDQHALISHGLTAIRRQVDNLRNSNHKEAFNLVQDFQRTLETHLTMLDARLKGLGGSATSPVKDAVSALAGVAAGIINAIRPEEAAKSIRDDYTYLSLVSVSYLMLHTTSAGLGDRETATLAERGYQDCARMIMQIDRVIPNLVIEELRQDGLNIQDVSEECRNLVKRSWNREAKPAGMGAI